jgi:NAD-dependent deacetylase
LVLDGAELELDKNCVIETVVDDENVKMFFDTGAKISYIHSKFTNNIAIFGQSNDFFPGYGRFDLETCHLKTHIGTKGINIRYGKLPEDLEERLLQYTDGIIGIDLLKSFNCLLSFKRNTMVLQPYKNKKIVFFTGAGISAESGISTFRDSGGVWEEYDIEKVCSAGCLDTNRDETLEFYDKRRFDLKNKRPNKAHYTIAKLQEEYPKSVHIITQNVDDLFEKAGCKDVLHLHGFLTKVRCEDDKCDYITDIGYSEIGYESCPLCGEYLRPDVVFFGEEAPNYLKMYSLLKDVDITVVIGTSGNVINVNNVIENSKYNILNNLEQDNVIDDKKFDKLIYSRATVAIDEIEKTIIKAICEN